MTERYARALGRHADDAILNRWATTPASTVRSPPAC